ncbi:MAG: hypothetical protein ACKO1V_13065, partial [Cyanobium sp.]
MDPALTHLNANVMDANPIAADTVSDTRASDATDALAIDLRQAYEGAGVEAVLDELDHDLIGLRPVKARIREIAALLVVKRARREVGLETATPSLHMS